MSNKMPLNDLTIEEKLEQLYSTPTPDTSFAARLEQQLIQRAAHTPSRPRFAPGNLFRRPVFVAACLLCLAMIVTVGAVGPQQVLAEVQRLLGYAPGVGFLEPGKTRYLAAPVQVSQGIYTLTVNQVIANEKETRVSLIMTELPEEKFTSPAGSSAENQPYLLLPDGSRLFPGNSSIAVGLDYQASFYFSALPAEIHKLTLIIPRLPSLPEGAVPENWSIPISLQDAAQPGAGESTSSTKLVNETYAPAGAEYTFRGVKVWVSQVGQSVQETGLQVQFTWQNPAWKWLSGTPAQLFDDLGQEYTAHHPPMEGSYEALTNQLGTGTQVRTLRFDSFMTVASRASLRIPYLWFDVVSEATIPFEAVPNATVGQTWDLAGKPGMQLEIAGVPVEVLSAELQTAQKAPEDASSGEKYVLSFLLQTTPQDGVSFECLFLQAPGPVPGSSGCDDLGKDQFKVYVELNELPAGRVNIGIPRAAIRVEGPWQVEWQLPEK